MPRTAATLLAVVVAAIAATWLTSAMFRDQCDKDCRMGAAVAEQIARERPSKR